MPWVRERNYDAPIEAAAIRYRVPVPLIKATIAVESGFNPTAINKNDPGWAWGLMQMIPATARGLGYTGPMESLLTDPALAVDLGAKLLGQNLARSGNVVADSVSAYNGGFRPALGFGSPKPDGTYGNQAYVERVLAAYNYFAAQQGTSPVSAPSGGGQAIPADSFPVAAPGRSRVDAPGSMEAPVMRFSPWWAIAGVTMWGILVLAWQSCS